MKPTRIVYGPEKQAFALFKLLFVILAFGAMSYIAVPRIASSRSAASIKACDSNTDIINSHIDSYRVVTGDWL